MRSGMDKYLLRTKKSHAHLYYLTRVIWEIYTRKATLKSFQYPRHSSRRTSVETWMDRE